MQLMSIMSMKREKEVKKLKTMNDKATQTEISGDIKRMHTSHDGILQHDNDTCS